MAWTPEETQRIAALRREWAPREREEVCVVDEGTVETRRVAVSQVSRSGTTLYRCGGGRRVVRKRIGSN